VPDGRASEPGARTGRAAVELPPEVGEPFEVYLNGVRQEQGRDFVREGRLLVFDQPLAGEGRLGFWRWASMVLGIAGTYRRNDTVDVIHEHGGRRVVRTGLPFREVD
jgi:hypothetical protein